MEMNFELREMRPEEASILQKLARPNFSVVEQIFMSKPKNAVVAQTQTGEVAGAAFLVMVGEGEAKTGCVDIIFVLPQYRGSGIAKELYHEAVDALHRQGCNTVMALVRGDNSQSLRRFETEGLHSTSISVLRRIIGMKNTALLFAKTASLACATGCWILCEDVPEQPHAGGLKKNLLRVFLINALLLALGMLVQTLLHHDGLPLWNALAAISLLGVITLGETIGMRISGGEWEFVMPEGGLLPSAIVAIMGGFYPMPGHWYLIKRDNSDLYRKRMASPVMAAWIMLLAAIFTCGMLNKMHPFFASCTDLGTMLLILYMLPFYPFDTFGGKRIRENNKWLYVVLAVVTIILLVVLL